MADASWIYADLVGLIVGIISVALAGVFLDDFRKRFWWTKEHAYWTRTRLRLSSAGFLVADSCKSTISAWKKPRVIAALEIGGLRTHLAARFDRGRPTLRETALSFAPGIRRLGARFLPHARVRRGGSRRPLRRREPRRRHRPLGGSARVPAIAARRGHRAGAFAYPDEIGLGRSRSPRGARPRRRRRSHPRHGDAPGRDFVRK